MAPVIEIRDLVKRFGDQTVLQGLNLDVEAGETVVIMGGSGSGKSTLLRCMIGSLIPEEGSISVYGEEILREYRATQYLEPDWRVFLERCDPDVILWQRDEPLVQAVELLPEWRRLYEDQVAVILVRERPGGQSTAQGVTNTPLVAWAYQQ